MSFLEAWSRDFQVLKYPAISAILERENLGSRGEHVIPRPRWPTNLFRGLLLLYFPDYSLILFSKFPDGSPVPTNFNNIKHFLRNRFQNVMYTRELWTHKLRRMGGVWYAECLVDDLSKVYKKHNVNLGCCFLASMLMFQLSLANWLTKFTVNFL